MQKVALIIIIFFFSVWDLFPQVTIKQKVEIDPTINSMRSNQLNPTQGTISHRLDVEFSFAPYSYQFGYGLVGHIYGEAIIRREISQFNRPILASSGQVQGGLANLSVQLNMPYNAVWFISVGSSFGTTLGHDPIQFNRGNANVQMKMYLDGILQPESYTSSTYNQGYAVLVISTPPDFCPDVPECVSPFIDVPNFIASWYPNGHFNEDVCAKVREDPAKEGETTGIFALYNKYENYDVDVCYNKQLDRWQFIVNGGILNPIVFLDICLDNIALHNWKIIENISDIKTVYGDNPCVAKEDFEDYRPYPQEIRDGGFILKDGIMMHEHAHRRFYESLFEEFKDSLKKDLEEYNKTCRDFNYEEASTKGATEIRLLLLNYLDDIQVMYNKLTQGEKFLEHEKFIQGLDYVQNTIDYYIGLLETIYNCN